MRRGWKDFRSFATAFRSRTSQSSNEASVHFSTGSETPIPSTEHPDFTEWVLRKHPMNPAAPVIITFIIDPRSPASSPRVQDLLRDSVPLNTVRECRYLYTRLKIRKPQCACRSQAILERAALPVKSFRCAG